MMHKAVTGRVITSELQGGRRTTGRFRHVIFADAIDGAAKAVDFATVAQPEFDGNMDEDEGAFLDWLFQTVGLDVQNYRRETLARRLPACLRKLKVSDVSSARLALLHHPDLVSDALSALLIGVTEFFRDVSVFDEIANRVLPELLQRKSPLRILSAACSDGSELYSIAMLLAEMNATQGVALLGTDCRADAIHAASNGVYALSAIRGVSEERLAQHFHRVDASDSVSDRFGQTSPSTIWRVNAGLRALTRWRTADVMSSCEAGVWDLILFRNAAMYLRAESASMAYERLAGLLAPGGYLVLGKAEKPKDGQWLSSIGNCLYRRTT